MTVTEGREAGAQCVFGVLLRAATAREAAKTDRCVYSLTVAQARNSAVKLYRFAFKSAVYWRTRQSKAACVVVAIHTDFCVCKDDWVPWRRMMQERTLGWLPSRGLIDADNRPALKVGR